jgi:hypothetical protein
VLDLIVSDPIRYRALPRTLPFETLSGTLQREVIAADGVDLNVLRGALVAVLRVAPGPFSRRRLFLPRDLPRLDGLLRWLLRPPARLEVAASSVHSAAFGIEQLLSFDDPNGYFASESRDSEWIEFRFAGGGASLTHYALRGWKNARAGVCPVAWVVRARGRGGDWSVVDEREGERALLEADGPVVFPMRRMAGSCVAVRFEQRESGSPENGRLVLSGIEFYGIWHED